MRRITQIYATYHMQVMYVAELIKNGHNAVALVEAGRMVGIGWCLGRSEQQMAKDLINAVEVYHAD